ncbi:maleylacetoacetate isomerase [Hyalella azteca]|uniref:maleylacetoacetate isomerase n=1 Tax=Hyalella azteca TaxID=294128 RepID=A0A8B7NK14_HYAAZ|nr:maleylacetoacetate isomerase [Hyalella azteca]
MSLDKLVLYSYFRSSSAWRIRLVLAMKGVEYEYSAVNLLKGEQTGEDFLKLNPLGQVPALLTEGQVITQSAAIFEYLEEKYPEPALLPKDKLLRAKVREASQVIVAGIQPLQNLKVIQALPEEQRKPWAADAIIKGFTALEKLLEKSSGKYCVGDAVSWADCCLVPQIFNAGRFGVDMAAFPIISRIGAALGELEAFKAAHPTQMSDCPADLK